MRVINMTPSSHNESLYCQSVRAGVDQSPVTSAVVANSGNLTSFVSVLAFRGIHLVLVKVLLLHYIHIKSLPGNSTRN